MRISDTLVVQLLKSVGKVTDEQLKTLQDQEKVEKKPLQDLAIRSSLITEPELTKLYALEIDVPYVDLDPKTIRPELLKLIPERIARQYKVVVYGQDEQGNKLLAMADPDDIQAVNFLRKQLGPNIKVHLTTSSTINAALEQYRGNISSELPKVITPEEEQEPEEVSAEDLAEDSPIAQTVNVLIEYAVTSNASDIHIEPRENFVLVRYRVDGILREVNKLPRNVLGALVSRIKILSNLKIDERRVPQDGRFKIEIGGQIYAMRVSTLPVVDGEKVAMRILNETAKAATLSELGFWGVAQETIQHAVVQPHGMVLVTGPTGSGKSTTLFSVLSQLNKPGVNISTIEDPVEYRIQGTNQTQVNTAAGMTFSSGLRALLRQDPNIIMVGEIRDNETANLAVQAALTGHLVFSTLHTNNAATSLPRLLDMSIEPFLIASTVRAVVGQRLVRKLCVHCREVYQPDEAMLETLGKTFHANDPSVMQHLNQLELDAIRANVGGEAAVAENGSSSDSIVRLWKAHEQGCENCNNSGYKGRMGIYEVLDNSSNVQKLIVGSGTSEQIQNQAVKDGMVLMQTDGLIKALRGLTSIEEILRVTAEQ
jgi:type IV pilus assembly protein PilB